MLLKTGGVPSCVNPMRSNKNETPIYYQFTIDNILKFISRRRGGGGVVWLGARGGGLVGAKI